MTKENKKKIIKWIKIQTKELVETVVFVVIAVIVIRFFIGELRWIPSGSMHPTLIEKDRVFVEKIMRPIRPLQRGDIVVFYPPSETLPMDFLSVLSRLTGILCKDTAYIKRIIGLPGEKLEIRQEKTGDSYVYINGKKLDEPYISSTKNWTICNEYMYCKPFVIPDGEYFMMGDNRGNSQDSRFWGTLPYERIIGRSIFIFWPIDRIRKI